MNLQSSTQLSKYKDIKSKLTKNFPKGRTEWLGFTIDISYGGNKHHDISRLSLGGVAGDKEVGDAFLALITKAVEDNIAFWQGFVEKDIKELEESLKK